VASRESLDLREPPRYLVGRQAPAVCRSRQAELLDLRGCGSRVHVKERSKSRWRRPADCLRRDGAISWTRPRRHAPLTGSPKKPIRLYQAWEGVVDDLYGRYSFGKLMVTDPQRDWDTALARIYAAVR
jgi:hypothetical protein